MFYLREDSDYTQTPKVERKYYPDYLLKYLVIYSTCTVNLDLFLLQMQLYSVNVG